MNIPEDIPPPHRSIWHINMPHNIIIINYNIMSDILDYYYTIHFNKIHYTSFTKLIKKYNRRI